MGYHAELVDLELPDFGLPTVEPIIPAETYRRRIVSLHSRAREEGYDVVVVYGDREHFANLAYLTGFDPRFEEAMMVLNVGAQGGQKPVLMVGNEGLGYLGISPIRGDLKPVLYQSFSLIGQKRGESRELGEIMNSAGVVKGARVGALGWKSFGPIETKTPETTLEIPSYIVDTLRDLCGGDKYVLNANALLMHPTEGLRAVNDVD